MKRLRLDHLGISAHSARAGFATDAFVAGWLLTDIQLVGRWSSLSSLKIYLDALMSRAISAAHEVGPYQVAGTTLEKEFFLHFPVSMA